MRPDRAVVKKAIEDAEGNLSRATGLLGCSRQTLYTWIYQLGLEKIAGIRLDRRAELDSRERQDARPRKPGETSVYSADPESPKMRLVMTSQAAPIEMPVNATVKLPESLWRRAKIAAIRRGVTVGQYVQECLAASVGRDEESNGNGRKKEQR